ncbi:unnamed protein product [Rhizophagus irregularis]|nr:unnamed protein product [Rhizophagus irregularis]
MQKAIQNALAQQKTENQTLTAERSTIFIENRGRSQELLCIRILKRNRFIKIEEGLEETQNNVNQLADLFQKKAFIQKCGICGETGHSKGSCPKRPIAQSKFTRSYFMPLIPIVPSDSDGEKNGGGGYNRWIGYDSLVKKNSQPETYDQLLSKLSLPIRKMCLSRKTQEEESKESDEWLSSLQYLNDIINDLTISESFLDSASEFGGINDPAIKALGWEADKPSNFAIKGNSKHITDSLGWYTDVPVTLKDKENKTVTVIGNLFVLIMVKQNQCYFLVCQTFESKTPVVKDLPKEEQDQVSTDSSSPTREDLKKSA